MMYKRLFLMLAFLSVLTLQAQTVEKQMRKGNRAYRKGNYSDAEVLYRKVLNDSTYADAWFNLGDALYMQKNYMDAINAFDKVVKLTPDPKLKSKAIFNKGNCLLEQDRFFDAFNIYKEALKTDPDNEDALYNLEYCRAHLVKSRVLIDPRMLHGSVAAKPDEAFNGQRVALVAKPDEGYALSQIIVIKDNDLRDTLLTSQKLSIDFEMPKSDVMVVAEFKQLHKVSIDKDIKHGTVTANPPQAIEGQSVKLNAQAEPRYKVSRYKVYKTGSTKDTIPVNNASFKMPDFDVTVSAEFKEALRVSVDETVNGKISVTDTLVFPGQNVGVIVKPDQGYQLDELAVVSDKDSLVDAPVDDMNLFKMLDTDVTVRATFKEAQEYYRIVTDNAIEGGKVSVDIDKATPRETVDLHNTPDSLYRLKEYKICQEGDTAVHVQPLGDHFTMPSMDVMVSAVFEEQKGENQDQQQQQQQQQNQQDQQGQDDQQDQQNQQGQGQQDQQSQQQQQQPASISKEDAQRMLDALEKQEKKTMEKVNEQKIRTQPKRQTDKDW